MSAVDPIDVPADENQRHIIVVDDDPLFRESITQNLRDCGYTVEDYPDGVSFLTRLADSPAVDLLLLDWKMPHMNGIEVLARVRDHAPGLPVIFLTVLGDQIYEEAALLGGAVDFVEKSRSFAIVRRRIELIPRLGGNGDGETAQGDGRLLTRGPLRIELDSHRAYWQGSEVDLTLSEFGIVHALAKRPGTDVPYREIYDLVRGSGFVAGHGAEGFRTNVRSAIKRIRQKFRDIDPAFDCIENYPGFGYRWRSPA